MVSYSLVQRTSTPDLSPNPFGQNAKDESTTSERKEEGLLSGTRSILNFVRMKHSSESITQVVGRTQEVTARIQVKQNVWIQGRSHTGNKVPTNGVNDEYTFTVLPRNESRSRQQITMAVIAFKFKTIYEIQGVNAETTIWE